MGPHFQQCIALAIFIFDSLLVLFSIDYSLVVIVAVSVGPSAMSVWGEYRVNM